MDLQILRTTKGDPLKTPDGSPVLEGTAPALPIPPPPPFVAPLSKPRSLCAKGAPLRTRTGGLVLRGPAHLPVVKLSITGVTKDSTGAALGGCTVSLYRTSDDRLMERVTSDGSGNYSFSTVGLGETYYVVAYLAGSPDVFGSTVNTLVGS